LLKVSGHECSLLKGTTDLVEKQDDAGSSQKNIGTDFPPESNGVFLVDNRSSEVADGSQMKDVVQLD
jgi:hypothetical protein